MYKAIEILGLKAVLYSQPFKVSWIDSTTLEVRQQCFVLIDFN